jgi:hypothetical protein
MKRTNWMVVVTLVVLSGLAAAQRMGSTTRIVTEVPFEFMVSNKIAPAGEYVVQEMTMDGKTLAIRNADARVNLLSTASLGEAKESAANYTLIFNRYGDRYFLSGIKLAGSKTTYHLAPSKVEAELQARNVSGTEETLLASVK